MAMSSISLVFLPLFFWLLVVQPTGSFAYVFGSNSAICNRLLHVYPPRCARVIGCIGSSRKAAPLKLAALPDDGVNDQTEKVATASSDDTIGDVRIPTDDGTITSVAATNTINERLMAELQEAAQKERFGPRSAAGKKLALVDGFGRRRKSDEEIKAAIAEARDLNGVNPVVAILGSFFAFAVAAILWVSTNKLGVFFASHPPETDVYFIIRTAQVFRNVVMGLISLASGFFGVTGMGIFLLGVRVAYGVLIGELDPTPIKKSGTGRQKDNDKVDISNVWDMMMNKKPGRRGGGGGGRKNDNETFGL